MAANGGTALRNLDKFRNRTKKVNTVTPQPNYSIANLPKSQNEMVHFLEKLAQEMAVQKDTDSRVQALRKLCDLVYLLVQLHQQNQSWRQRTSLNNEDKSEETAEEDAKDNLDGEQLWNAFLSNAKILRNAINFAVTDDKLAIVAREACETMVTLATLIKDELAEPLAEHLVASLWKASNSNISGVSEVAVKALRTFIQYVQHRKLVKAVLNLFTNQPMTLPMSRNLAAEFIGNVLIYQKPTDFQPYLDEIEKIIALGLKDSSSTIKATYRKNFWLLAKTMPEQVQEWVIKMDTIDWRPVQEMRPAEAPSITFGRNFAVKDGKTNEHSNAVSNGTKKAVPRKTTSLRTGNEREGNHGKNGRIERSHTSTVASKTSLRNTSTDGESTRTNIKTTERTSATKSNTNMKGSRTTVHTISSSAKRISNDKMKKADGTVQKLSLGRNQEKEKQSKGENLETIEADNSKHSEETQEKEDALVTTNDALLETPKEENLEPPVTLLVEQQVTETNLQQVLEKLNSLTDIHTKVQIIQTIENHLDNALKEIERQKTTIPTISEKDSHWIRKDEEETTGPVEILHFIPLVLDIVTKYLLDENEKLVVPAMKSCTKLFKIFAFQEVRQHNRTLETSYRAMEENFRENYVLLQKIFEKCSDSNGFIASTATTVLEEMELAIPFFPVLLELISRSCLQQSSNQELPVKVVLQALLHIKAAIQKNRRQDNSYFGGNIVDNSTAISIIELLVKDVGPHAGGKSAELRRAACDVFMELEEVPVSILEQVAVEKDESKHLHLLQRLGLIASSVTPVHEKTDVEISMTNNNHEEQNEEQQTLQANLPPRKESCEVNSDASESSKTNKEDTSKSFNGKNTASVSTNWSKTTTPAVPLEDTFQSEFEALKEKWMRNKEHVNKEGNESEEKFNDTTDQEQSTVTENLENQQTSQVCISEPNEKAEAKIHLAEEPSNVKETEHLVAQDKDRESQSEKTSTTSCMEQAISSNATLPMNDSVRLLKLRSNQDFIKNIALKLCTVNREDERECSTTLTEIREELRVEENTLGVAEIYDLLFLFLLLSREKDSSQKTSYLVDMEFLWQMNFRELWKRTCPMDCLEALDMFCWEVHDGTFTGLGRFDYFLQTPGKEFEVKMLFQGLEHALKVLENSVSLSQQEQMERLKPAILNALHHESCLEIKQAAHKCLLETRDRLREKQDNIPFLDWCRELDLSAA